MSGIDLIVYGILLTFTLIGTTEFVIGLLLIREYDKLQEDRDKRMKHYEKPEDMSLPQILEDIHDRICDEYCKWPSQYPLATDDEAYNRMGEEHCDKCPVRRLT